MHFHPLKTISGATILIWMICAYAIKVAEQPHQAEFEHYFSCLWLIAITMTTVGYGDISPVSIAGQVVIICTTAIGTCLVALLVEAVRRTVHLNDGKSLACFPGL